MLEMIETVADETAELPDHHAEGTEIRAAVRSLPARERRIVILHFWHGLTLQEIGGRLGVTRQRTQFLERVALDRLRRSPLVLRPRELP